MHNKITRLFKESTPFTGWSFDMIKYRLEICLFILKELIKMLLHTKKSPKTKL